MGTIVNAAAVLIGGSIGLFAKKIIKPDLEEFIRKILGFCVMLIGVFGIFTAMATVGENGKLATDGMMLLIISLVLGGTAGCLLKIEAHLAGFGDFLEKKIKVKNFSEGFIAASMLFCAGAMTILGSMQDGLAGDASLLYVKALLDGISALLLASTMGGGVLFSVITILVYQGGLTLAAGLLASVMSEILMDRLSMVGYAIVACIGMNLAEITTIKTADLLPALLIPILYTILF
ncbi:MAG: DUF554 domain-containing protein [Christensenellaceae bacterium]|jgi:uncharacterized membrane protein YqgA involved in biofilm formation